MKPTQRFVAGATCPKCHAQDAVLIDSEDQSIECVDCGYTESAVERDSEKPATKTERKPKNVSVDNIIRIKNVGE